MAIQNSGDASSETSQKPLDNGEGSENSCTLQNPTPDDSNDSSDSHHDSAEAVGGGSMVPSPPSDGQKEASMAQDGNAAKGKHGFIGLKVIGKQDRPIMTPLSDCGTWEVLVNLELLFPRLINLIGSLPTLRFISRWRPEGARSAGKGRIRSYRCWLGRERQS